MYAHMFCFVTWHAEPAPVETAKGTELKTFLPDHSNPSVALWDI